MLDPQVAFDTVKGQGEDTRANQDEDHEGGQLGRAFHGLLEQGNAETLAHHGHHQGTEGPHGAALGRGGNAQEDGAQHQEDQHQRRN